MRPRRRLVPPVQGHDANAKGVRNFALQFPLRRQFICLRQFRRDIRPRVPFLFSYSSLHSTLPMLRQFFRCALDCYNATRCLPNYGNHLLRLQINMKVGCVVWCLGVEFETWCEITLAMCKSVVTMYD